MNSPKLGYITRFGFRLSEKTLPFTNFFGSPQLDQDDRSIRVSKIKNLNKEPEKFRKNINQKALP